MPWRRRAQSGMVVELWGSQRWLKMRAQEREEAAPVAIKVARAQAALSKWVGFGVCGGFGMAVSDFGKLKHEKREEEME